MGNMFGMFPFASWVIRTLKCEGINIPKVELTGIPVRPFECLRAPILIIACVPCMHVSNTHARCDVTRFTYDANHITITSPAFTFHSCHIEMRWHDMIGVCVVGTPHHHGLHRMGSCRHDIIMFLSCSHHVDDVIRFRS